MPTIHLLIKGKVQGVFYRATAKEVADEIGLRGWVKNTEEGDVEAMVSGSEQELERYIKWAWEGPRRAKVTDVIISPNPDADFTDFKIVR